MFLLLNVFHHCADVGRWGDHLTRLFRELIEIYFLSLPVFLLICRVVFFYFDFLIICLSSKNFKQTLLFVQILLYLCSKSFRSLRSLFCLLNQLLVLLCCFLRIDNNMPSFRLLWRSTHNRLNLLIESIPVVSHFINSVIRINRSIYLHSINRLRLSSIWRCSLRSFKHAWLISLFEERRGLWMGRSLIGPSWWVVPIQRPVWQLVMESRSGHAVFASKSIMLLVHHVLPSQPVHRLRHRRIRMHVVSSVVRSFCPVPVVKNLTGKISQSCLSTRVCTHFALNWCPWRSRIWMKKTYLYFLPSS